MQDNETVFRGLYDKHSSTMIYFCYGIVGSKQDAEDYVQIMFKLAWEKIDFIKKLTPQQQKKWIYTALKNIIKDKEESKQLRLSYTSQLNDSDGAVSDEVEQWISKEMFPIYMKEVKEQLNDKDKELFTAAFEDKIPYTELSERYGKNVFSLAMQISRLRKKLKPMVEKILSKE